MARKSSIPANAPKTTEAENYALSILETVLAPRNFDRRLYYSRENLWSIIAPSKIYGCSLVVYDLRETSIKSYFIFRLVSLTPGQDT